MGSFAGTLSDRQLDDLPSVLPYERELPDIPDHVRQQAAETEKAIRERNSH